MVVIVMRTMMIIVVYDSLLDIMTMMRMVWMRMMISDDDGRGDQGSGDDDVEY